MFVRAQTQMLSSALQHAPPGLDATPPPCEFARVAGLERTRQWRAAVAIAAASPAGGLGSGNGSRSGKKKREEKEKPKPQPQQHVANPSSRLEESLEPDEACLREMAAFFRPENERLFALLGRRFDHWHTKKYYN